MTPNWQILAEQASKEMDPNKLAAVVTELNRVLCEGEETSRKQRHQGRFTLSRAAAEVGPMFAESRSMCGDRF
jgi:hypothetical protein